MRKVSLVFPALAAMILVVFLMNFQPADSGHTASSRLLSGFSLSGFTEKMFSQPAIFLLQLVVIMLSARLMGYLFQLFRQPMVLGEIVAGLLLGPSVFGALAPQLSEYLFPENSLSILQQLSQLGLIFFMFIIGMELDPQSIQNTAKKAVFISISSILIPFVSGLVLAFYLYNGYAPGEVHFTSFALFMGTTMCITAFPILARIVQERKLTRTPVGTMAITVAAIGDVVAWCILAIVVAVAKAGNVGQALVTILLSFVYIVFMLKAVKPVMHRIGRVYASREAMGKPIVALVFLLILLSAGTTEIIGIHALFGAFMAGVVMPDSLSFKRVFTEKIEDVSLVILLPLFFVATGLRTEIGLINSFHLWVVCLLIIAIAIIGKFGGTLIAARYAKLSWNHSLTLSVLMNAKGLMELIVLNIGYDLGILSPEVFAMLVIMALATTFLTGPGLALIRYFYPEKAVVSERHKKYKVLLSFASPTMGDTLLNLARQLTHRFSPETLYAGLHISPRTDLSPRDARAFEKEAFVPFRRRAEKSGLSTSTIYRNTADISQEIIETCQTERPDFLLLGSARPLFSADMLGGIVRRIINETHCDVLIFNEKSFSDIRSVLVICSGENDPELLRYVSLLNHSSNRRFFCYSAIQSDPEGSVHSDDPFINQMTRLKSLDKELLSSISLVIVMEKHWKKIELNERDFMGHFPSILFVHRSPFLNRMLSEAEAYPHPPAEGTLGSIDH